MHAAIAIAVKDLRLLCRDGAAVFFVFLFPLGLAVFFGFIFPSGDSGEGSKLEVALVNEDGGPASQAFAADLTADELLSVKASGLTDKVEHPLTREEGETLVRKGKITACVVIPKGFEESVDGMFSGGGIKVEALVDPGHSAEAGLLTGKLNQLAFMQMSRTFSDPSRMTRSLGSARARVAESTGRSAEQKIVLGSLFTSLDNLSTAKVPLPGAGTLTEDAGKGSNGGGWQPVDVRVKELTPEDRAGPRNSFEISFPQGMIWGLMGCVTAFGVTMASERSQGTLLRLSMAPISRNQILLGKALGCFLSCVLVQVLLLIMATLAFKVHVRQPLMMTGVVLANSIGFVGVMMVMAGFARTEGAANGMGRAVIIVLAMIGGGTIPLAFMPPFMQTASSVSPFKWATMAIEGAVWRGYSWADMALPVGVLLGFGVIGFVIGAGAMRRGESA